MKALYKNTRTVILRVIQDNIYTTENVIIRRLSIKKLYANIMWAKLEDGWNKQFWMLHQRNCLRIINGNSEV